MGAFKELIIAVTVILVIFNAWLAFVALFVVSDAYLFGALHAFISFGMGFIIYKIYNNGI